MQEPTGSHADLVFQRLDQAAAWPYTKREYLVRLAWEWVWLLLIRPSPRRAYGWRLFWLRLFGAKVASTARVRPDTRITFPALLTMGEYASVAGGVHIYNLGAVVIGDHSVVSQGTHLCAGTHDYTQPNLPLVRATITIGRGVWVAADAFIGPGVTVGDGCVVGARSVVCSDLPPGVVVAGNPARVIKARPRPTDSAF